MKHLENREENFNLLIRYLQSIADIPDDELEYVKKIVHIKYLKKGDLFIKAGEVPEFCGFICSGLMRVFYIDEQGRDFTKLFNREYNFVSSYAAFIERNESLLNVEALEDTTLFVIDYDLFRMFIDRHSCWLKIYTRALEKFYVIKERREGYLLWQDAKTRYAQFLKDFPGLEKRVKQYYIASYLGISPVSLSRIRAPYAKTAD
ncbi:MAG: Crp/Fnr family transcriptional regulator [Spirochaetes bacterium]|nr:Crp/Fnr family transcriptional regulator [Spirochaetota bacterium]